MDRQQFASVVGEMRQSASMFVQRYAAVHARDVPMDTVEAFCRALGEISVDEATAALDRLQREHERAQEGGDR